MKELLIIFVINLCLCFRFNVRRCHIGVCAAGGVLTWTVYTLVSRFLGAALLTTVTASFFAGVFSEICARVRRAPQAVFLFPSIIPLLPGSSLFYCMKAFVAENYALFFSHGVVTAKKTLGLSAGLLIASALLRSFSLRHPRGSSRH